MGRSQLNRPQREPICTTPIHPSVRLVFSPFLRAFSPIFCFSLVLPRLERLGRDPFWRTVVVCVCDIEMGGTYAYVHKVTDTSFYQQIKLDIANVRT